MVGVPPSTEVATVNQDVKIRIFPNPVQETLYVESDNEIRSIAICNSFGSTIKTISPKDYSAKLDLFNVASGIYVIKVTLGTGKTLTQKLVKE